MPTEYGLFPLPCSQLQIPLHIVSINWSASFVAAALGLKQAGIQQGCVHANELEFGPGGRSTGALQRRMQCAHDKSHIVCQLLQQPGMRCATGECDQRVQGLLRLGCIVEAILTLDGVIFLSIRSHLQLASHTARPLEMPEEALKGFSFLFVGERVGERKAGTV